MSLTKILIGDDQIATDHRMKRDFEWDYEDIFKGRVELTYTADPQEFIKMAQTKQYDVLLIDLKWGYEPHLWKEGYRILEAVKDCAPKRILCTSEEKSAREIGYEYGATHCISKRLAPEEMEKVIFG